MTPILFKFFGFAIILLKPKTVSSVIDDPSSFSESSGRTINQAGSETVSSLIELYISMKKGDCQLPQAAMLQPQEREAFISFINEGKVDINSAESLKNALTYANCLYPQKLMNSPL